MSEGDAGRGASQQAGGQGDLAELSRCRLSCLEKHILCCLGLMKQLDGIL